MSNKQILKYLWLVVALVGYPTGYGIVYVSDTPQPSSSLIEFFQLIGTGYYVFGLVSIQTKGTMVYALFFLALLLWSCVRWVKAPSLKTLLWTLFTGWILCGFPGMIFLWLVGSSR